MVEPWQRIEPTTVHRIDRRKVSVKHFVLPDGSHKEFAIYGDGSSHSVAVLALTSKGRVVVARQFRPGPERIMDELPGGKVDDGETPEVAAARELKEETGYIPGKMVYLGEQYYDAYTDAHRHCFLALDCRDSGEGQSLDEGEFVEVRLISIDQLLENVRNGCMTDPGPVLLAYETLLQLKSSSDTVQ